MKAIQKKQTTSFILAVCMLLMSSAAYANMIQGEVTEVNPSENYFRIARTDPESKAAEPESIKVYLSTQTLVEGIAGLQDLRPGDEVWTDIAKDELTQNWLAIKVRLDKVDIRDPGDAAAAAAASSVTE